MGICYKFEHFIAGGNKFTQECFCTCFKILLYLLLIFWAWLLPLISSVPWSVCLFYSVFLATFITCFRRDALSSQFFSLLGVRMSVWPLSTLSSAVPLLLCFEAGSFLIQSSLTWLLWLAASPRDIHACKTVFYNWAICPGTKDPILLTVPLCKQKDMHSLNWKKVKGR